MPVASLTLVAPYGLLVCLLALVPLGVVVLAFSRQRRVAAALGLEPMPLSRAARAAALPAAACLLLGIAVAQPILTTTRERTARTSSEVVFVTDVSRSMSASPGPGARSRLERARAAVARLRDAVPAVPAGNSGLTDRVLPYLFPTLDRAVFADTLARSVQVDAPLPIQWFSTVATTFEPLGSLAREGFFAPRTEHRTCVLVSDGETRSALSAPKGCRLLVVRVGGPGDRIYGNDGKVDPAYRPERSAAGALERLARVSGGEAFSDGDLGAASAALRKLADTGPLQRVGTSESARSLAPFFAGLALVTIALVVARRYLRAKSGVLLDRGRRERPAIEV